MTITPLAYEVDFNGLVGPTHNYSGLSYGNVASLKHRNQMSNPLAACLQGLKKMHLLHSLGIPQGILPPPPRPQVAALRQLGFSGKSDSDLLAHAYTRAPLLAASVTSSSAMWAANAATISPSADTVDGKVHITPANLIGEFHRSLETSFTSEVLRHVFPGDKHFVHHHPLPATPLFADEGAANHTRLCTAYGLKGVEVFVYGRAAGDATGMLPRRFPARQTKEASEAVARLHGLDPEMTVLIRQSARSIDAGVFHNDVICVGNGPCLLLHEEAFEEGEAAVTAIRTCCQKAGIALTICLVTPADLALEEAVRSYLFNSQIVTLSDGSMALIAPLECQEMDSTKALIDQWLNDPHNPIARVEYVDLKESMQNGGGPACLRLRVALTAEELAAVHPPVLFTEALYPKLVTWAKKHYRDRLSPGDLSDPLLIQESERALEELSSLLSLGSLYTFHR